MRVPRRVVWAVDRHLVSRTFSLRYRPGRALIEALSVLDPPPGGVEVKRGTAGGRPSLLVVPDGALGPPRILWTHGGAFCFNSPRVYTAFAGYLSLATGESVILPTYRLAPEHPYPAAPDDVAAAYQAVAAQGGPVLLGGDSAGANLALGLAIALRDAGEAPPAGLLLMSPWVDLTLSRESVQANDGRDAILRAVDLPPPAAAYAGGLALDDPRVSPLNADLSELPPALIQCGSDELFLSEGRELAARLEAAGTTVELDVTDDMWHDFQSHAAVLPEAAAAVERMAAWAKPLLA